MGAKRDPRQCGGSDICPHPIITQLISDPEILTTIEAATPMGRLAEPEEIADAILFLAPPSAAMITGAIRPVNGSFLAR
jgi:NAD(P)-dependent dehydrogenase (short-subunit alcohol dehydrogenase family)